MKKSISFVLAALVMLFSQNVLAFSDIPQDNRILSNAAKELSERGIINGDGDGTFRPGDSIIRAEMAQILSNLLPKQDEVLETAFSDLDYTHWAYNAISVMNTKGIIKGDDVGTVRPDDVVTNAEAVTMIIRMLGLEEKAVENGGFPIGYINTAMETTLLNGLSLALEKPATRGDVAIMIYNMLSLNRI